MPAIALKSSKEKSLAAS